MRLPNSAVFHSSNISMYKQPETAKAWPSIVPQAEEVEAEYIYVCGKITAIFPSLSVEQEFYQSLTEQDYKSCKPPTRQQLGSKQVSENRTDTPLDADSLPDLWEVNEWNQRDCLLYQLLSKIGEKLPRPVGVPAADLTEFIYIAREVCWILQAQDGIDRYAILPTEENLATLIKALKPAEGNDEKNDENNYVVIGETHFDPLSSCGSAAVPSN